MTDAALVTAALRLDTSAVLRDGDPLGRMIDTFVLSQIRPEAELRPVRPRLYHLREQDAFAHDGTSPQRSASATGSPSGAINESTAWVGATLQRRVTPTSSRPSRPS